MLLSLAHIRVRDSSFSDFLSIACFLEHLEAPQLSSPFLCQPVLLGKGFKWLHLVCFYRIFSFISEKV